MIAEREIKRCVRLAGGNGIHKQLVLRIVAVIGIIADGEYRRAFGIKSLDIPHGKLEMLGKGGSVEIDMKIGYNGKIIKVL